MRNTRRNPTRSRSSKTKWIVFGGLGLAGYALYRSQRQKMRVPRSMILDLPAEPAIPASRQGSIQFVGTATCLIRYGGFTILTDPNFLHRGEAVHLGYGMQSTRLTEPAIQFEELPPVDFVVLSHMHEDHFDTLVQRRLNKSMPILTTTQAARALERKGFRRLYPLDTWDRIDVRKGDAEVRLTSMPGTHGPMLVSSLLPSVMGSMLEFRNPATPVTFRMYLSGDTLIHDDLKEIPRRYPNVDVALLHLGGTRIMGILVTMDAKQGGD
ncbi:MAG: MBL fold metallo-hydrolase, partial [Acidobacteria bacterium]|nr:MBL fold metallo-hydrolase [Acidobacteriota bacterium]